MRVLYLLMLFFIALVVAMFWVFEVPGSVRTQSVGNYKLYTYVNTGSGNFNTLVLVPKNLFVSTEVYDFEAITDSLEIPECLKVRQHNFKITTWENGFCTRFKYDKNPQQKRVYKITQQGTFDCESNCK